MNIRPINFMIAIFASALIAYMLSTVEGSLQNYVVVGSFLFLAGTLTPAIGIEFSYARRATNLRMICGIFFTIGLLINGICTLLQVGPTTYIIGSALTFLLFAFVANAVYGAHQ